MSKVDELLQQFTDDDLNDQQATALVDCLNKDPAAVADVYNDLRAHDLLLREMNPERSDAAFMASLDGLLDGGFDGADGDGSNDVDPDMGDGGMDPGAGVEPSSSGGMPTTDPATVASGSSAGSTAAGSGGAVVAGSGGGIAGFALASVVAVVVCTAVFVTTREPAPTPAPSLPVIPEAAAIPAVQQEIVELVSVADAYLDYTPKRGRHINYGSEPSLLVRDITNSSQLKFDLSQVDGEITSGTLRLYCEKRLNHIGPITVRQTGSDWQEDSVTHHNKPPTDPILLGSAKPSGTDEFWEVRLADEHLDSWRHKQQLSLRLEAPERTLGALNKKGVYFASKEHENAEWHPVLILEVETSQ